MAKDFKCTQVRVLAGVPIVATTQCNAEEEIKFEFTFDIRQKLEEEINEKFAKKLLDQIKEAEDRAAVIRQQIQAKLLLAKKKISLQKINLEFKRKIKEAADKQKSADTKNPLIGKLLNVAPQVTDEDLKKIEDKLAELEKELAKIEDELTKFKTDLQNELQQIRDTLDIEKQGKIADISNQIPLIINAIKVHFAIKESVVTNETNIIKKSLVLVTPAINPPNTEAIAILTFPEQLAGARLDITYAFEYTSTADTRTINQVANLQSSIDIRREDGAAEEIDKVYWTDQDHPVWEAQLSTPGEMNTKASWLYILSQTQIGFLHIHTKGLFGKGITSKIESSSGIELLEDRKVMRDNMLSIPYRMNDLFSRYKQRIDPNPTGGTVEIKAIASTTELTTLAPPTDIDDKPSEVLKLNYEKKSSDVFEESKTPPVKVNITTDEEVLGEPTKAKCIVQFRPKDPYNGEYGFDWVRLGDTTTPPTTATSIAFPADQKPSTVAGSLNDFPYEHFMGKHYYTPDPSVRPLFRNQIEHNGNNIGNSFQFDKIVNSTVCRPILTTDPFSYTSGTTADDSFGNGKMYKKFKHRFRRLLFDWDPHSADPHSETYTPIMTIMKGVTAELNLYLDIKEKPKGLRFDFDDPKARSWFSIKANGNEINLENKNKMHLEAGLGITATTSKNTTFEIECKKEFDRECTLIVRAFKEDDTSTNPHTIDQKGEVCGMLRILPNGKMYQREIEVVIVNVITNFNGTTKEGKNIPTYYDCLVEITNLFPQAYVIPKLTEVDLSTIENNDFRDNYSIRSTVSGTAGTVTITTGDLVLDPHNSIEYDDATKVYSGFSIELDRLLNLKYNNEYSNSIRLYFLDEIHLSKDPNRILHGYSVNNIYGLTLCFATMDNHTAAHELGHTLGLAHPFDGCSKNTLFTHHFVTTNNLMDYTFQLPNGVINSLYHWQWQIINSKIR